MEPDMVVWNDVVPFDRPDDPWRLMAKRQGDFIEGCYQHAARLRSDMTARCTMCGDTKTRRYGSPCPECADAKDKLWMAGRIREQWAEIERLKREEDGMPHHAFWSLYPP